MKYPGIEKIMAKGVADAVFPGAVLLCARGTDVLFHGAYGVADLSNQRPLKPNAIFDLASLTKPLATALAVSELVRGGKLSLDTSLGALIPAVLKTPKADISIEMLLRHTSGLPAHREFFWAMVNENQAPREILRNLIVAQPLEAKPGHQEVYSDLGYMVLSWVVETIAGQRLDRFVQEKIYDPLGIRDLFFIDLNKKPLEKRSVETGRIVSTQTCPWRGRTLTGEVEDENAWAAGGIEGHAGLFGDAASIHTLCSEIFAAVCKRSPLVLDPEVIAAFVRKDTGRNYVAGFDTPSKLNSSAGHCFAATSLGHLGFTGTSFWINPASGLIVILLTNRVHPSRANQKIKIFRPQLHDVVSMALG